MNTLIQVDFIKRCVVQSRAPALSEPADEPVSNDLFNDLFGVYDRHMEAIKARLGGSRIDIPLVYKQKITHNGFDTYGYGNCHNSIHQYMPKDKFKWNNPFPMPANLRAIDKFFKVCDKDVQLVVGLKSDPFMWMDLKYGITKSILILANQQGIRLHFKTMSDLCAHDEYIGLIKAGQHTVEMHMGFEHLKFSDSEKLDRQTCPGAPSKRRRVQAVDKLTAAGIPVKLKYSELSSLIKKPGILQTLCRRTGTGRDYWINPEKYDHTGGAE